MMRTPLNIYKYQRKYNDIRLINEDYTINVKFLRAIFDRLSSLEYNKFVEQKANIEKKLNNISFKKENDMIEHKLFTNKEHYLHTEYIKQFEYLFGDLNYYKERYYNYFWGEKYNIDEICKNYLTILFFNLRYYFGINVYWRVCNNSIIAPLPSDISNYLKKYPTFYDDLKINESKPVTPFVLLAYIMPPQSMIDGVIPDDYKNILLDKYPEYFPETIELKLMQPGGKLIYTEPHLENPPIELLEKELKKIKLTNEEKERNTLRKNPIVYFSKK